MDGQCVMARDETPYESPMLLTELRPRLTRRLLDLLSMERVQLPGRAEPLPIITVGLLLRYARLYGNGWMMRLRGITKCERNRLAEALEEFWLAGNMRGGDQKASPRAQKLTMGNPTREIVCCEFCGRDTTSRNRICNRCWGGEHPAASREYRGRKIHVAPEVPIEDDYSEESGPD